MRGAARIARLHLPPAAVAARGGRPRRAAAVAAAAAASASMAAPREEEVADPALWADVCAVYDRAQAARAATLTATRAELLDDGGVRFILRVAAALRDKPRTPPASTAVAAAAATRPNPFLPPDPALVVRPLPPAHLLLLNKFNVVPRHALVVTAAFAPQEAPLEAGDLAATWAAMAGMPGGGLAYFNSGPASGASQPHRHTQVVPLPLAPEVADGAAAAGAVPFEALMAAATARAAPWVEAAPLAGVPFAAHVVRLEGAPPGGAGAALKGACDALMAAAARAAGGAAPASYNLVLTRRFFLAAPRRAEADGPVSVNAVGFAGSFFVRSAAELEHVRAAGPMAILARVGFPAAGGV
jgi:ATP adenylyltransferase